MSTRRSRRKAPVFDVEYATLPPRQPKREKRKARREANRTRGSDLDTPRRQREPLEGAPRLRTTQWW